MYKSKKIFEKTAAINLIFFIINSIPVLPVTTTETNFEPKWPSGDSLHGFGCLFCKSAAMIHSSELKKCDFCKGVNLNISDVYQDTIDDDNRGGQQKPAGSFPVLEIRLQNHA